MISPVTLLAVTLTLSGLVIAVLDIRWSLQLVSLSCVYSGALLASLGLVVHLMRGHLAWAAEGGMLLTLAVLVLCSPLLPANMQDYLEYLMP
ncbi:hypothetical protein [Alcanivorax sp. DP30]|uniref:hypothetical protein n=1 Tax=Alcanivorax sp. DP30 TaxID=2606217 RepID=UPI00136918D1|nr:hypothetical protein [Alcanivorax sp. DP30]MZR62113.1 hypothetical protein [Alcanivorax sp. DP30]